MNIEQAREKIREVIRANATELDLSSYGADEKLTSNDLEELTPEAPKLWELKTFLARDNKLTDISFLAKFADLHFLGLGGNEISDLSVLKNFVNLSFVFLWGNRIRDISPLTGLRNLTRLELKGNPAFLKG